MGKSHVVEITKADKVLAKNALADYASGILPLHGQVVTEQWVDVEDYTDVDPEGNETVVTAREQMEDFVKKVAVIFNAASALRGALDKYIWENRQNGGLPIDFPSIRAERTGEAPGRKPTERDDLDRLLGF